FVDEDTACFRFIVLLLGHRNRLRRIADLYAKRTTGGCDAEVLVAEATDQIKRFLRGFLLRETERVGLDLTFDRRADLRRCAKKPIRRDQTLDALVWTLEVVVLDEELDPPKTIGKVSEYGLAKKFVPQRLPETFDLAERLRMLRSTLAVCDAATPK